MKKVSLMIYCIFIIYSSIGLSYTMDFFSRACRIFLNKKTWLKLDLYILQKRKSLLNWSLIKRVHLD